MKNLFLKKVLALAAATMIIITSQVTGFAVDDTIPPTAPTNLTYSNLDAGHVTLSWTPSTDNVGVRGYAVYNGDTLIDSRYWWPGDSTTWVISGLYAESTYCFRVKAWDGAYPANFSDYSNSVVVVTPADTTPPTVPGNFRCYARSGTSWGFTWNYSTDNVELGFYRIYVFKDGQSQPCIVNDTTSTTKSLELEAYHSYEIYVKAIDIYGNISAKSNSYIITPSAW